MTSKLLLYLTGALAVAGYPLHLTAQEDPAPAKKDPALSKAAFRDAYKVLMHPRCRA